MLDLDHRQAFTRRLAAALLDGVFGSSHGGAGGAGRRAAGRADPARRAAPALPLAGARGAGQAALLHPPDRAGARREPRPGGLPGAGGRAHRRPGNPRAGALARAGRRVRGDAGRAGARAVSTASPSRCSRPAWPTSTRCSTRCRATTWWWPSGCPPSCCARVRKLPVRFVADLYNPIVVEGLEAASREPEPQRHGLGAPDRADGDGAVRGRRLRRLRQREAARPVAGRDGLAGLVDLRAYRHDPTYRQFVDVVPFGVPSQPPQADAGRSRARGPASARTTRC